MKQLLALFAILLTVGTAHAQTDKTPAVTRLPGEEKLSIRERAERDFLMPVRRKQVVADAPKTSTEDNTASPELDADNVTAHANAPATDEVRTIEEAAAPAHETRTVHSTRAHAVRHSSHSRSVRYSSSSKARSSKKATHSSKKSASPKAGSKKASTHKAGSSRKSSAKKGSSKKTSTNKSRSGGRKSRR